MYCPNCGKPMPPEDTCPYCGWSESKAKKQTSAKKPTGCLVRVLAGIGAFFVIMVAIGLIVGSDDDNGSASSESQLTISSTPPAAQSVAEPVSEPETEAESEPSEPAVPQEYKNALSKAQIYSDVMHMSRLAIFDQLVSEYGEGFPREAAQYAIDNLVADYNQNALEKAKVYYYQMSMSKDAVRDQLVSAYGERFTESEADYAIENLE